jgi:hypothetical protein
METIPEMTVTEVDRVRVTGDPGRVADERPDPEMPERARRRSFTAQYKLDVAAEYDAAPAGEKGAVLRREGLYSSHVIETAGQLAGRSCWRSPGSCNDAAALVSASRASALARSHAVSISRPCGATVAGAAATSFTQRLIKIRTRNKLSFTC